MKKFLFLAVAAITLSLAGFVHAADQPAKGHKQLKHVVAFKFKSTATPQQIADMEKEFAALKEKIPGIVAYAHGTNNSPEGKNHGFTNVYELTFLSEQDRDAYLPHPAHKAFGKIVGPLIEDVLVLDFWTE